jgi:hypothetical protein
MSAGLRSLRWLKKVERGLFAAATIGALAALFTTPRWTVDDAYIVQRYAENWIRHGELTWNIGEPHLEGYTGIVLPCIYALASLAGGAGPKLAALVGALSLLGTAAAVAAAVREVRSPPPCAAIAYALYLSTAEHYTHAVSGLETTLFTLGLSLTIYGFLRAVRDPDWEWRFVLIAAFTALTRPEGIATSLVALTLLGWERLGQGQLTRLLHRALLGFAVPVGAHEVFRVAYYHAWLPNSYFAKLDASGNLTYFRHWWQLIDRTALAPLALAPIVMIVGWVTRRPVWKPATQLRRLAYLTVGSLAFLCLAYGRSNLVMDYSHRFETHAQPFVILWAGVVTAAAVRSVFVLARLASGVAVVTALAVVLLLGAAPVQGFRQLAREREFAAGYELTLDSEHRLAARWLNEALPRDATLAVYPDAGIVPLLTGLRTIDFGRLNDAYLAREARSDADVVGYFFTRHPDALATVCYPPGDPEWPTGAEAILADPRMDQYELVHRYPHPTASVRPALCVYVRRSLASKP